MARIEKTVFISYRRTDVYTALAVYENLKNQGYDVFFDYRSISSGDFEQIITSNIRARAHFLLILTPTALDRCNEPGDWLRREIELAIDEKRNIVPLFFKGFRFGGSSKSGISKWFPFGKPDVLTGKLANLIRYNGLNVHEDYFDEAMMRVRTEYLSKPLDTVLHPVSTEVQRVVEEEKNAADEAIKQKEDKKEPIKPIDEKPDNQAELEELKSQAIRLELKGEFWQALQLYYKIKKLDPAFPRVDVKIKELEKELIPKPPETTETAADWAPASPAPRTTFQWQSVAKVAGIVSLLLLFIWGGSSLWNTPTAVSTQMSQSTATPTLEPVSTSSPTKINTPAPTPTLGVGSTMIGKDGMTLLYVPAGEFTMGSENGGDEEKPVHKVYLDAFWIDQTEVTNAMFVEFLHMFTNQPEGGVTWIDIEDNDARILFSGNKWMIKEGYEDHPVTEVSWYGADKYCAWVERRLPTEAEWEKAARGMDGRTYPWGENIDCSFGNYRDCIGDTTPVGSYSSKASPYGALDMAGNVFEWVNDWYYSRYYHISPDSNPQGPLDGNTRVLRGGAWFNEGSDIRSFIRSSTTPSMMSGFGFRCAMDGEPKLIETFPLNSTNTPTPTTTPTFSSTPKFSQGTPVSEWEGIPIMPQAIDGREEEILFGSAYHFTIDAIPLEIFDYYESKLPELGWKKSGGDSLTTHIQYVNKFRMELTIIISEQNSSSVVSLFLQSYLD